jgi:Tol biopolymer transport system component
MRTNGFGSLLRAAVVLSILLGLTSTASAQYFGRNKVQWEDFDFKVLRTEHFDIYYYDREKDVIEDVGRMAERWYDRLSPVFQHQFTRKPIVLYANPADFQQTTTTSGLIGQGTGGFTDQYQNRIVMPLAGNYAETDHVLGHEMVHVFQYELSNTGARTQRRFGLEQLPLWLIEGMAEYFSKGRIDPLTSMWVRDATNRNKLPDLRELTTDPRYFPYRYGHALLAYVGGRYGDDKVVDLLLGAGVFGLEQAFPRVLGVTHQQLFEEWHAASRAAYEPFFLRRPATLGDPIFGKRATQSDLNIGPAVSPDGRYMAFLSTRSFFSIDLYLANAQTGELIDELVSSDRDPHFEAVRFIDSAGSWSPDSKQFAFVTFQRGDNWLGIADAEARKVTRRIKIPNLAAMTNLAWSPDGRTIVISGQATGVTDLFLYDVESGRVEQLTSDKFADLQPAWSPDGRTIAFVTDRGEGADLMTLKYANLGIATIDVQTREIRKLPLFQNGKQINPQYGPDGSIYFIGNPEGIADVYRYSADGTITQLTRVATGVSGITDLAPALTVAMRTGEVYFSIYESDDYNIYRLPNVAQATATVATSAGEAAPNAAILPPASLREETVTRYLQQPELGLDPDPQFARRNPDRSLRLTYLGPPTLGVGVDRFGYGVGGTISAYFSDVLGEHNAGFTFQGGGSSSSSLGNTLGGELFYINRENRVNWGGTAAHIPYVSARTFITREAVEVDGQVFVADVLNQRRQITTVSEAAAISQYPLGLTRRFELNGGYQHYGFTDEIERQIYVGGQLIDTDVEDLGSLPALDLFRAAAAFVGDSSTFGFISPVRGTRYRFEAEQMGGDLNFTTALADYRRYFYARPITFAVRGMHYGRYGSDSEDERMNDLYIGRPSLVRGYEVGDISLSECGQTGEGDTDCPVFDRLIGSKLAVFGAELRLPLFGVGEYGLISGAFLPTEFVLFADGGAAWTEDEDPDWKYETDTDQRVPVFSYGAAVRILLAYIPLEFYYAKPLQRPEEDWVFGFNISPGW